ncbi:MAG TPA: hypothetical protein VMM54_12040 [Nitrospirota bacterium]|nr:hypothetical protein [Nitrospirota bacterium]
MGTEKQAKKKNIKKIRTRDLTLALIISMSSPISIALANNVNNAACQFARGDAEYALSAVPIRGVLVALQGTLTSPSPALAQELSASDRMDPSQNRRFYGFRALFSAVFPRVQLLSTCCAVPYTFPRFLG